MIAIFTDFGVRGPYLGQMEAVLSQQAPGVPVVDIFPDLPAFNIRAAAYLLPAYSQYLPDNAVCLCVVDPGVGTSRRALAVQADGRWYVGPDNGLFTLVLRRADAAHVFEINWCPAQLSSSFHGRDLFAPVAARLACGESDPGTELAPAKVQHADWPDDLAQVVYIDDYGNAISGMRASSLGRGDVLQLGGQPCCHARVFGEAPAGQPFWYENSNGLAEIAWPQDSAASRLGISVGATIGCDEPG